MEHRLDWFNGHLWYALGPLKPLEAQCELDAAREMLKDGLASLGDTFVTYRGDIACLRASVKWASEHVIAAGGGGSPVFARFSGARLERKGGGRGNKEGVGRFQKRSSGPDAR